MFDTSKMLFVLICYYLSITCSKVTFWNSEVQSFVSKCEEIVKDVDIIGSLEHHPSRHWPTCREPMLMLVIGCKNNYVTSLCSATVLPLLTAIVYKCCQCNAPISGYDDVPAYLKYFVSKYCIFFEEGVKYDSYI